MIRRWFGRWFRWPAFYTTLARDARSALAADSSAIFAIGHPLEFGWAEPNTTTIPIFVIRASVVWFVLSAEVAAGVIFFGARWAGAL